MHIEEEKLDPKILSQLKWDKRDVSLKVVYISLAGVALTAMVGTGLGYLFVLGYEHPAPTTSHRVPVIEAAIPAGAPYLQTNSDAPEDIAKVREHENDVLTTAGPGADPGFYHIPVEAAMRLTLQRGLPVTGTVPAISKPVDPNAKPGPVGEAPPNNLEEKTKKILGNQALRSHDEAPRSKVTQVIGSDAKPSKSSAAPKPGGKNP